jgi:outer membrane protein with beta-barrel domain
MGGRAAYFSPSGASGMDASAGLGFYGSFRFRPFWSVELGFDRTASQITNGPNETLEAFTAAFEYTFRSDRQQRTRPYMFFGGGLFHDGVSTGRASLRVGGRTIAATSTPESDTTLGYALGVGGLTQLTERAALRYEIRLLTWSTFGSSQSAADFVVGMGFRLGR